MFLDSVRHQLKYNCDPDRVIYQVAVNKDFMPLASPLPASEITCPRCGGSYGYYIPAEKAWGCVEQECLRWQIGYETGSASSYQSRPYKKAHALDYGVPELYDKASLKDFEDQPQILSCLNSIVYEKKGYLLLAGSNGTGKTHACAAAIQAYLDTGRRKCRFISASALHKEWKMELLDGTGCSTIQKYSEYEFLIIDDLGIHTPTENFMDVLYMIVDARMVKNTIVTTNMSSIEMKKKFGMAIFSRLASGMIKAVAGVDRRLQREWVC